MTDLYLFRKDLRLEDNPGLAAHRDARRLLCVYIQEPPRPWFQTLGVGQQRERFCNESLSRLQLQLRRRGQELLVVRGAVDEVLSSLVQRYRIERVGLSATPGNREAEQVAELRSRLPVPVLVHQGNTLFERDRMREWMPELPKHYAPFRDRLQAEPVPEPMDELPLPPKPAGLRTSRWLSTGAPHPAYIVRGGTAEGRRRLNDWLFRERAVEHYHETRNALEGLYFASGVSPWLANGSLSVRMVASELRRYEQQYGHSDSSRHVWHELLWREFFHWRAYRDPVALFRQGGGTQKLRRCTFEPRSYARWCAGSTDYPLVNALMHQLVATGWMSNRGRQIAASCLINELGLDWRYGAAFFEKHLLDFDVASNYGNWQYIAGVGADPRGGRHFNLEKQAALYDPDGHFTLRWEGDCPKQPQFVTDAADWPIAADPQLTPGQ